MKYFRSIIVIFFFSISSVILLLYFANITRAIERENSILVEKIDLIEDQININEIEYSLFNSYLWLSLYTSIRSRRNRDELV